MEVVRSPGSAQARVSKHCGAGGVGGLAGNAEALGGRPSELYTRQAVQLPAPSERSPGWIREAWRNLRSAAALAPGGRDSPERWEGERG